MKKTQYHSLDEISQEEFIKLFRGALKKLFDYAESQEIIVKPFYVLFKAKPQYSDSFNYYLEKGIPLWISCSWSRYIFVDLMDLELSFKNNRISTINFFAHEIAHIKDGYLEADLRNNCNRRLLSNFECPFVEYHCWKKGIEILESLKISINKDYFWDFALRCVGCHKKFCPEFEECKYSANKILGYTVDEKHIKTILSRRKEAQEFGEEKLFKDYKDYLLK